LRRASVFRVLPSSRHAAPRDLHAFPTRRSSDLFGAGLGDGAGLVPAWPTEFAELQREYPIFFRKDDAEGGYHAVALLGFDQDEKDRKSTRLNSSHVKISYAVFCLKKKTKEEHSR